MTEKSWYKLKKGSVIRSVKSKTSRVVLGNYGGVIVLKAVSSVTSRLWSGYMLAHTPGKTNVHYSVCDKSNFKVIKF